jgi:hypothetical protein
MKKIVFLLPICYILNACVTNVTPQQQFSDSCAKVGEAMVNIVAARRAGKIDDTTFNKIDDTYDAAVATCENPPLTDNGFEIASSKLLEFAYHMNSVVDGVQNYGGY